MSEVVIHVTIAGTYSVDTANYPPGSTPEQMANIDKDEYDSNSVSLAEVIDWLEDEPIVKFEAEK